MENIKSLTDSATEWWDCIWQCYRVTASWAMLESTGTHHRVWWWHYDILWEKSEFADVISRRPQEVSKLDETAITAGTWLCIYAKFTP